VNGAWEELRNTGAAGPLAARLVYETVDAVRRFDRYPPPEGTDRWDETAVQEVSHEFLFGDGAAERLARLVATATDEESFERLLEAAVRNEFRMQARRTNTGAALRALTHAIERDGDIVVAGATTATRTWSLPEHQSKPPYSGPHSDLIDAAYAVPDVRRARWSQTSTRRPPIAESDSLRRVLRAVLDRAEAPVTPRLMLDVILARFPPVAGGDVELTDELVPEDSGSPGAQLLAAEVWEQLTDNERLVAGILDLPVRDVAAATGLSRSTAHRAVTAAKEVLAAFLSDLDDKAAVVAALAAASASVRERGTGRAGSASTSQEED
jgi:hypothetical protein